MTVNLSDVKAYWCKSNNFGDALTPWIINKLTGLPVNYCEPSYQEDVYMVTGSILNWSLTNATIWGCGLANYTDRVFSNYKEIRSVRGPLTAKVAKANSGIIVPDIYGDPALLLPKLYSPEVCKRYALGILPHYADYNSVINRLDYLPNDILIIDLMAPVSNVITSILACDVCVSSSLHGIIASHAYGIPCKHIVFSDALWGDGLKFEDYYTSVNVAYQKPLNLSSSTEISIKSIINYAVGGRRSVDIDLDLDLLFRVNPFYHLYKELK